MARKKAGAAKRKSPATAKTRRTAAKRPARGQRSAPTRRHGKEIRVRMYRQGLGDCFLLSFPKPGHGEFHVLIDCGVILGTPDPKKLMEPVVADIVATTNNHIDVLVATHEHWDHVSGFDQVKEAFDSLAVDQVWLAWTEDPANPVARKLRNERAQRLAALWMGIGPLRARLAAAAPTSNVGDALASLDRAAEVLSFFGIDHEHEPPPAGGLGAAAAAATSKTGAAMTWVRKKTANPRFLSPGEHFAMGADMGVRVYVLGPPTDPAQLHKDLPSRAGRETYDDALRLAAVAQSTFGAAAPTDPDSPVPTEFQPALPFEQKYWITQSDAKTLEFFRERYFGTDDAQEWRRIDGDWTAGAAEFALQLDSDTNNTSLALAFELPNGRVLLFPGDAQVGNWESWHADTNGTARVWNVDGRKVTAEHLLNETVLYKVGHHGSHNATLRDKGLEMMTHGDLVAMVPVDVYIAHDKKRWTKMPFAPLMHRLAEVTQGRVVQADQPAKRAPGGRARISISDSDQTIKVVGPNGKTVARPLFVDFVLPL